VARLQLGYASRGVDLELIAIEAARISKVGIVTLSVAVILAAR